MEDHRNMALLLYPEKMRGRKKQRIDGERLKIIAQNAFKTLYFAFKNAVNYK